MADFTHHAHTASLSAVAVSSRFVVTGSKDETIHIYDMKKKIDHGALVHHNGKNIVLQDNNVEVLLLYSLTSDEQFIKCVIRSRFCARKYRNGKNVVLCP